MAILLVAAVALLCFVPGTTTIAPMDRDEARFAQASKQMVLSGDYVTPRFQQDLRAKKPVGIYWMQSASANFFGIEDISSYRLPSILGGVMTVIITAIFAQMILPKREAIFASLFMATSLVLVVESHLAKTDAMLAAVILLQQIMLWKIRALDAAGKYVSGKYALIFWGAMAASILIKGPIGVTIAATTILMIIVTTGQWRDGAWRWVFALKPTLGLIILTGLVLPWVVLVTSATDGAFLNIAIKGDFVSKLQSGQESHGAPPLTYLGLMMITFWPGSLFLARAVRRLASNWRQTDMIFLISWLAPFWIILEITPTKLPHYNLPVFAALAMLASLGIAQDLPKRKAALPKPPSPEGIGGRILRWGKAISFTRSLMLAWEWGFMAVGPLLGLFLIYAATAFGGDRVSAVAALLAGCGVSAAAFWWQRRGKTMALAGMIGGAVIFHMILMGSILPSLDSIRLAPRIKAELATISPAPEVIAAAGYHEPSLVFALGTDTLLFSPDEAAFFLAEADGGLALIERRSDAEFRAVADEIGLQLNVIKTIKGFNISRGKDVTIFFYQPVNN